MNIFITYSDPKESARVLDDKRIGKMIIEAAQMLCAAHRVIGTTLPNEALYKLTHENHPCNVWLRESAANYKWLLMHYHALNGEYWKRFEKPHACLMKFLKTINVLPEYDCKTATITTKFPNCAKNKSLGIDYTDINNVPLAYRRYLTERWDTAKVKPKWYGKEDNRPDLNLSCGDTWLENNTFANWEVVS